MVPLSNSVFDAAKLESVTVIHRPGHSLWIAETQNFGNQRLHCARVTEGQNIKAAHDNLAT